jgi:hypothetical protein
MEVGRRLVYPCQTMLDDVQIDASSYVVVKVDMVHENLKDLKLEVLPDDTTLTMWDVVTRRVQWRTSIDVDPSVVALASTTLSQLNTTPASIFLETHLSSTPIREEPHPSPILEEPRPFPIQEQQWKSAILAQSCRSLPRTRSALLPTPDQTQPKVMKNACGKSQSQQRKMTSKATKGKQPLKERANLKLPSAMMQSNLKFVMGKPMLTTDTLDKQVKLVSTFITTTSIL